MHALHHGQEIWAMQLQQLPLPLLSHMKALIALAATVWPKYSAPGEHASNSRAS